MVPSRWPRSLPALCPPARACAVPLRATGCPRGSADERAAAPDSGKRKKRKVGAVRDGEEKKRGNIRAARSA